MFTERQRLEVESLVELFDKTEKILKEIETLDGVISFPPINELRYAGYHLCRSISIQDEAEKNKQLQKAQNHSQRAFYDAHEIGVIFFLDSIEYFRETFQSHFSSETDFIQDLLKAEQARKLIDNVRKQGHKERAKYFEECEPHYHKLKSIHDKFREIEPILAAKARRGNAFFILALAGTISSVISLAYLIASNL